MSSTKPSNPKDSIGIKKAPMSTVSAAVLAEIGVAMLEGASKYGRHNYRAVGVRGSVYYDATMRHMDAWWKGEHQDGETGQSHLAHAMCCLMFLQWLENNPEKNPPNLQRQVNKIMGREFP